MYNSKKSFKFSFSPFQSFFMPFLSILSLLVFVSCSHLQSSMKVKSTLVDLDKYFPIQKNGDWVISRTQTHESELVDTFICTTPINYLKEIFKGSNCNNFNISKLNDSVFLLQSQCSSLSGIDTQKISGLIDFHLTFKNDSVFLFNGVIKLKNDSSDILLSGTYLYSCSKSVPNRSINSCVEEDVGCSDGYVVYSPFHDLFKVACSHHDYCYRHGNKTYGYSQEDCDNRFLKDMYNKCDNYLLSWPCKRVANLYYEGVTSLGGKYFKQALESDCCVYQDDGSVCAQCGGDNDCQKCGGVKDCSSNTGHKCTSDDQCDCECKPPQHCHGECQNGRCKCLHD